MLSCLAFLFCNTSHIKHMERGHSQNGASHYFLQIFPAGKETTDFSAYLTLCLRDLLYLHFYTTTCNMVPRISLVTGSQHVNPLLRIFPFLETCEWPVLALRRSPQWMVETKVFYSLLLIPMLPVPPTFEPWTYTPWICKVIEGLLRPGNAEVHVDAVIEPIRAGTAEGHSSPVSVHFQSLLTSSKHPLSFCLPSLFYP